MDVDPPKSRLFVGGFSWASAPGGNFFRGVFPMRRGKGGDFPVFLPKNPPGPWGNLVKNRRRPGEGSFHPPRLVDLEKAPGGATSRAFPGGAASGGALKTIPRPPF